MQRNMSINPGGPSGRGGGKSGSKRLLDRRALLVAVALGMSAAVLSIVYLSRSGRDDAGPVAAAMTNVVVAARDIEAGEKITAAMIELSELPTSVVIASSVTSQKEVVGQTLRYPVAKGEQLNSLRMVDLSTSPALSFRIPPGLRGFTVPVNVTNTPAALIAPGDFVDVVVTAPLRDLAQIPQVAAAESNSTNDDREVTVTLLQNVQVLAVQRQYLDKDVAYDSSTRGTVPESGNVNHVTLALTPAQGQLLWQAANRGKLTLALRAFGDDLTGAVAPITEAQAPALSYQIPLGLRAFTVPVNPNSTPASLITPGDFVDVVVTGALKNLQLPTQLVTSAGGTPNGESEVTVTVLQNVQVLAVQREYLNTGTPSDPSVRGAPTGEGTVSHVTLALTPEQGQLLWQAARGGSITLALRAFGDDETSLVAPITVAPKAALSYQIPTGLRAFTVPASTNSTPSSLITPGDFVDVVVTGAKKDLHLPSRFLVYDHENANDDSKLTLTLLQNVQVLAVERRYVNIEIPYDASVRGVPTGDEGASYVTLALTPEDGQLLWQAASGGELTLALRGFGDAGSATVEPITEAQSPTLSRQLTSSMRAFTLPVKKSRTPAPLIAPGDFVDVLVGFMPAGPVMTILQDAKVLAVQQEYFDEGKDYADTVRGAPSQDDNASYVTLSLTPEESQVLWLAVMQEEANLTRVTITVRPYDETFRRPLIPSQSIYPIR